MSSEADNSSPNGAQPLEVLSPLLPATPSSVGFKPLVTIVDFHHARGPEVEAWFGVEEGFDPAAEFGWTLLPFMALSDGAHATEEDFSYFTLLRPQTGAEPATSLFGIACTRQLDATQLIDRPAEVTRSTVQKAVVVIADSPQFFGMLRQRLSIVTQAWFAQRDFTDTDILRAFQESLADEKRRGTLQEEAERDQHLGMSLRELIHEFKWQTLVLLKCCLLQPKMLFFGSRCDRLCMVQFSLISLIPGLIRNLQDCADPELNNYEQKLSRPTSLKSSNRSSLLSFMGLPLQIFGKGSLFGPYTPLQQLDILADFGTKSYIVGSTNSLLLQQKDRYSDIIINLDEDTVTISSTSLKAALSLTAADRRWIDFLTQEINDTWDEDNPSRPNTLGYRGSEEFIRSQFEAYILGLISSVKFHKFLTANDGLPKTADAESDPAIDYGLHWVDAWMRTENYRMWDAHTDENLFAVSEPKHPCAGGLTIDDIQRHISEQVKELHLDERLAQGRDLLGRNLAAGRDKASIVLSKLYSDVEYLRESQRRRAEETRAQQAKQVSGEKTDASAPATPTTANGQSAIDLAKAQQTVTAAGAKAGAFMSSWAAWAGEKRKTGGWGGGWGKKPGNRSSQSTENSTPASPIDRDYQVVNPPGSLATFSDEGDKARPATQGSVGESILSGKSSVASGGRPASGSSAAVDAPPVLAKEDKPKEPAPASKVVEVAQEAKSPDDGFTNEDLVGSRDDHRNSAGQKQPDVVELVAESKQ
ncbi:hypothetical protein S7711_08447 [Stachybotrys chartarum IBT 7711]|uniref:UDENN domain-containing protein n=1 Tax=Stachybotrys chartarum (strain CBS 109288 / IBT 7711) TaxID=1280523 RepID=A0A084AIC8_STACB|nr:hypothetical protein S7711_08447 [Stachybotrys chartarum IBT 7711]